MLLAVVPLAAFPERHFHSSLYVPPLLTSNLECLQVGCQGGKLVQCRVRHSAAAAEVQTPETGQICPGEPPLQWRLQTCQAESRVS